jgi:hypothetical protein
MTPYPASDKGVGNLGRYADTRRDFGFATPGARGCDPTSGHSLKFSLVPRRSPSPGTCRRPDQQELDRKHARIAMRNSYAQTSKAREGSRRPSGSNPTATALSGENAGNFAMIRPAFPSWSSVN